MTGRPQTPAAARTRAVHNRIEQVACPECGQPPGKRCRTPGRWYIAVPHAKRRSAAADAGLYVPGGVVSTATAVTGRMTPRWHPPEDHKCHLTFWGLPDGQLRVICEPCDWRRTFEGGKDIRKLNRLVAQHTGAVS